VSTWDKGIVLFILTRKAVHFIADHLSFWGLVLSGCQLGPRTTTCKGDAFSHRFVGHVSLAFLCTFAFLSVQRFVIVVDGDTTETVLVEENAGELTQTEAGNVLALLRRQNKGQVLPEGGRIDRETQSKSEPSLSKEIAILSSCVSCTP